MSSNRSYSLSQMDGGGRLPDEPVEPMSVDRQREAPESAQDLKHRLERLPHGHPSSPYRDDGTRKPPPPDLTKLELPLPDEPSPEPSKTDLRATDNEALAVDDADDKARINPDGSWEWRGCYLTPDQNRAADQGLERCKQAEGRDMAGNYGEHGLTPAMRRIEALLNHGQLVEDTEKYALKSPDRFKEKLFEMISDEPDSDVQELVSRINDGIRYTYRFPDKEYASGVIALSGEIAAAGYELYERKNAWADDQKSYKGVNSTWRDNDTGALFEVQMHTATSWKAKQETHEEYEVIKSLRSTPEEKMRARERQMQVFDEVPVPPGARDIPSYRKTGW